MTDPAKELETALENFFSELFRGGQVGPEDLSAVQIFPAPAFDQVRILWRPIWSDPERSHPEWGDLGVLPIRSLNREMEREEGDLSRSPEKLGGLALRPPSLRRHRTPDRRRPVCVSAFRVRCRMAYWYNVKTRLVETDDDRSESGDLLGPFATRGDAEQALATSDAHGRAAEASDAAWNQDDDDDD